jgi:hypothetical protein
MRIVGNSAVLQHNIVHIAQDEGGVMSRGCSSSPREVPFHSFGL